MAAIDLEKPGKYPIVLSDALMGLSTKEVYTGIRYNHKPDINSSSSSSLHLKPSSDSEAQDYNLSLKDKSDKYSYHGVRTSGDGQYVLIFNPEKEHFVLHRIDSTFDMNLISTPWDKDPDSLRKDYPQLETTAKAQYIAPPQRRADASLSKPPKSRTTAAKSEPKKPKVERPKKAKPVVREPTPEEADEESDDGLTVEYPDGPSSQQYQYQSTPVFQRDVSEEISDEDEDAEGEDDDMEPERNQDVEHLELPSPANNNAGGIDEDDMELDLEAELEQALKETEGADESSESEEE